LAARQANISVTLATPLRSRAICLHLRARWRHFTYALRNIGSAVARHQALAWQLTLVAYRHQAPQPRGMALAL